MTAMVTYLSMLNLGMHMYVVNRLNQHYTVGELEEYNRIIQSALKLFLTITGIGTLLVIILFSIAPFEIWLNFVHTPHITTVFVGVLLSLQILAAIPLGLIAGTYRTFGEFPRGQMIDNAQRFFFIILTAIVLALKGGLLEVAIVQLLPLIGSAVYVLKDLRCRHPEIKVGTTKGNWRIGKTLLVPSLFFLLLQLSMGFTIHGSILLVGVVVGPAAVAVYSIIRVLANMVRLIVGSFVNILWPELTSLNALKDYARLRKAHSLLVRGSIAICGSVAVLLHYEAKDIIFLWTDGRIAFDQTLMDLFLVYLIMQTPWHTSSVFPIAVNRHKKIAVTCFLSGVIGLGLAYLLSSHIIGFGLGAKGVILGILLGEVITAVWYIPAYTCNMMEESIMDYWVNLVFRGMIVLVVEWFAVSSIIHITSSPVSRFLLVFGTVFTVGLSGTYLLNMNKFEKEKFNLGFRKIIWYFRSVLSKS
jgi:O-antigen/teichoic acid export membrane protein